jgi:hypothetical protein
MVFWVSIVTSWLARALSLGYLRQAVVLKTNRARRVEIEESSIEIEEISIIQE